MQTRPQSVVWVDTLNLAALVVLLKLRRQRRCDSVRFLRASRAGLVAMRLLNGLGLARLPHSAVQPEESELRSEDGGGAWFEIRKVILTIVADMRERWRRDDDLVSLLPGELSRERAYQFLEKRLADELYDLVLLRCHVRHRRRSAMASADVVLVAYREWLEIVVPLVRDDGLSIVAYRPLGCWRARRVLGVAFRSVVLRPGALWSGTVLGVLRGRIRGAVAGGRGPTLAVAHKWGMDGGRMSDVFFHPGSGINPERVLIYFDDRSRPLTEEGMKAVAAAGMRFVVRRSRCSVVPGVGAWRGSPEYLRRWLVTVGTSLRLGWAALTGGDDVRRWQLPHLIHLVTVIDYWVAFYRAFDVRVDFHKEECDPEIVARAMAMELVRGVSVGCHWSYYQFTTVHHSRPQHVYFAWGSHYAAFLAEDGSHVDHLVYSGHIFDRFFGDLTRRRAGLREHLVRHGATFVVCLFDDSFGPGAPTSREAAVRFYRFFDGRLLADPTLGLIIKSKIPDDFLLDHEIAALLREAQATDRCLVLGAERDPGSDVSPAMRCLPVEAAAAADISVGLGVPTNSAAIQVALAGLRSVCWDAAKHFSHPFYVWGRDHVVFEDLERLYLAVDEYRTDPVGRADLGDYQPVLADIDPYRDGQAALRIGRYLSWLLDALGAGMGRREAMNCANRHFREKYGDSSVETLVRSESEPNTRAVVTEVAAA
jgi:hypothetical protein